MNRRSFLAAGAVAAGLAGCLGGASVGGGDTETTAVATDTGGDGSATPDENTLQGHPAARGLESQPFLGPPPSESNAVIVAFEDPSCTTCRRFEEGAFPKIKSELTDAGKATFVFRVFPNVYEWGKPASQALEATFAHDADAFWALKSFYYAEQETFTTDNVLAETERFLASETDVDAPTVVEEAREKKYDAAVQTDVAAAEDAAVWATPTSFLFRDGAFVTTATGAKSFEVFTAALGL